MSFYNMMFGRNPQSDFLLAIIGFKKNDIERFRDISVEDDGKTIAVYTRTGGNNRDDYPQEALYNSPLFERTEDDDFDNTYATFYFRTPNQFIEDINGLSDILTYGLRKEFCDHITKTLRRELTDNDKEVQAYEEESISIKQLEGTMANGHTFVPYSDFSAESAIKIAENNDGKLRSCWGILPLELKVKKDFVPYPGLKGNHALFQKRVEISYDWKIDMPVWERWKTLFSSEYPKTMSKISEAVESHVRGEKVT